MIRLLVLDIAGTTIDEGGAVYDALRRAVEDDEMNAGSTVRDDLLQAWMGTEKREAIRELTVRTSGVAPNGRDLDRMYERFRDRLIERYRTDPPRPFEGVEGMFDDVRANGVQVALTTGFSREIAEIVLAAARWSVGHAGTVDALVCSDEVAAGRPAPDLVLEAMARCRVTSVDEVLVAGDTVADLDAGMNAGVALIIGVTTGALGFDELSAEPHSHVLSSVAEITSVLPTGQA